MPGKTKQHRSQQRAAKKPARKFGAALARSKLALQGHASIGGGRNNASTSMTTEELCRYDDMCTALVIDPYMGFQTHKMNIRFRPLSNQAELKKIVEEFKTGKDQDYERTMDRLLAVDARRVAPLLRTQREQNLMRMHLCSFLKMFDKDAGFEIKPCQRYSSEKFEGGKLVATKAWKKNEFISMLDGRVGEMTPAQERELLVAGQNDFSVMWSNRKKKSQLWLGPAAYMNHDCRPNCLFRPVQNTASLQVIRDIVAGDEIVLSYGEGFFGTNNCNCECKTCEKLRHGKFKEDDLAGETRERLRQVPSRMCTRAERAMALNASPTRPISCAQGAGDDLSPTLSGKKPKVTRYDAKYIIQTNHRLPQVSLAAKATLAPEEMGGEKSIHTDGKEKSIHTDSGEKSIRTDIHSGRDSQTSRTPVLGDATCTPSNPCVSRPRGKRAHSGSRREAQQRQKRLRLDSRDENKPVVKQEVLSEPEETGDGHQLPPHWRPGRDIKHFSSSLSSASGLDFPAGSPTVRCGAPLSLRKNSSQTQGHALYPPLANGRLSGHAHHPVKEEPVRQSPRLRPRHASGTAGSAYGEGVCFEGMGRGNFVGGGLGMVEFGDRPAPPPPLPPDSDVDNDDSGLGEMAGGDACCDSKSLDSNHNFHHDPPVLERQVPFALGSLPLRRGAGAGGSREEEGEGSDADLNASFSSVPSLSFCGPAVFCAREDPPSGPCSPRAPSPHPPVRAMSRRQRPMLKIRLDHPDSCQLQDFNQQLEREGKSRFVQIEPHALKAQGHRGEVGMGLTRLSTQQARSAAAMVESFHPPIRLRLRSDKSGKVFKCLSPRAHSFAS